jgi:hypothetical protein
LPVLCLERALDGERSGHGIRGGGEDGEATVSFTAWADMDTALLMYGALEQGIVSGQRDPHRFWRIFPERGAALNIRQQKRHGSTRQAGGIHGE